MKALELSASTNVPDELKNMWDEYVKETEAVSILIHSTLYFKYSNNNNTFYN